MAGSKQKRAARAALLAQACQGGDRPRCTYCGVPITRKAWQDCALPFTMDHIIPKACGGTNERVNLAPCCELCNAAKADMSLVDFIAMLARHGANALTLEQAEELQAKAQAGMQRDLDAQRWARGMKIGWRH